MDNKTVEQIQLEQIEELKTKLESMVDPEEYKKVNEQYKTLLNDYVNKRQVPQQTVVTKSAKEIANDFIKNKKMTNREYIQKALEYREAVLLETGHDPFSDKEADPNDVEKTASILKEVLNQTDGDVDFRILLNNVMVDDPQLAAKVRKNR